MGGTVRYRIAARACVLVLAFLGALISPGSAAWAHDEAVSFSPSAGANLTALPERVSVTLRDAPGSGPIALRVVGPDGRSVTTAPASVVDNVVSVPVRRTADGTYHASYSLVSDDGHPVSGSFEFVLQGGPTKAAAPVSAVPSGVLGDNTGWHRWLPVAAALVLAGGILAWLRTRSRLGKLTKSGNP